MSETVTGDAIYAAQWRKLPDPTEPTEPESPTEPAEPENPTEPETEPEAEAPVQEIEEETIPLASGLDGDGGAEFRMVKFYVIFYPV